MRIELTTEIAAPRDAVWAAVADPAQWPQLIRGISRFDHAGDPEAKTESVGRREVGLGQLPPDDDGDAVGQGGAGAEQGTDEGPAVHRAQPTSCCLSTLPVALRGRASRKVTSRGTLYRARWSRT